jgi:LysM repeat protein
VVQPGDRLSRIAQRYGVNLWVLAQVNNIFNVNLIYVGQVLFIPDVTIQ